ncbi:hypothetical protein QJS04_geneDACA014546 [Acorus gramineus]|uniref:Protein MIZU-KUSSEI 1 n=1 Tax=Acorus gramineus TaxID=55184 RepID=A0AAV9AQE6_ACOGR|nr:hypothetical protein QJS04_geneDACA014546 [Acorus gramineus]
MKTINMGKRGRPMHVIDTSTDIDCAKDVVRLRRASFRSLVECMVPACMATTTTDDPDSPPSSPTTSATVTGTFFGHRRGRVSFCIQDSPSSSSFQLLLEFSVTTAHLAREMESGVLRIALECDRRTSAGSSLFAVPVWTLYFNGRKAGFAARRHVSEGDWRVLRMMGSVSVGAGVLLPRDGEGEEAMYLRASFDRVVGSADSESFHMINPVGCSGQELSVFFIRS